MLIDLTLKITPKIAAEAKGNENKALVGHLGTHFDVMNKEFPLEYTKRNAVVFDVRKVKDRDIASCDIDISRVEKDMFVMFCTGYISKNEYGSKTYFSEHPQLSDELIEKLLERGVSMIGVDCGGIRRGKEHTPADRRCADRGAFVIENLCNLEKLCDMEKTFTVNTYPMNFTELSGLPCRVIAEV